MAMSKRPITHCNNIVMTLQHTLQTPKYGTTQSLSNSEFGKMPVQCEREGQDPRDATALIRLRRRS